MPSPCPPPPQSSDWQARAAQHAQAVLDAIPPAYRLAPDAPVPRRATALLDTAGAGAALLSGADRALLALDATALRDALAARQCTAVEVARAYGAAAALAHQATRCLTDYFLDEALARAAWLDAEMARTGRPVGVLHGVPISVKDQVNLAGHATNAGFLALADNVVDTDAHLIEILRAAGAVFMCKTTLPQAIMHLETDSYLGTTLNPHNTALTAGGSSGGEGALVGFGGSPLGIGTDIGGSIRNPAGNCGIYGFKPTSVRMPKGGLISSMKGAEAIISSVGPMARSVRDLELFLTTVQAAEPWRTDPTVPAIPWLPVGPDGRSAHPAARPWAGAGGRLRIGVWADDGVVRPLAPVRRALDAVVEKLRADPDVELVEYAGYKQAEGWQLIKSLYFMDGGANIRALAAKSGEPLRPLTEWIIGESRERTIHELWDLVVQRDTFRLEYMAHFRQQNVDVILCPYSASPAPPHETAHYWPYTSIFNLVDYPGAVFPIGIEVEEGDVEPAREFRNPSDEENARNYDPKISIGAPICLQLVAPRWEDERLMAALYKVDAVVNGK